MCSPSSSAITVAVAASAGLSFGSPHSHLEARNRWWLWHFLFIDLAVELFILLYLLISNTLCYSMPILPQFLGTTILFFIAGAWLFSIPHIRGFLWYLSVCFWHVSPGITSSRLVHVVSYDRISFFLRRNNNPLDIYILQFIYPCIWIRTFRLLPHFGYCEYFCSELWRANMSWRHLFTLFWVNSLEVQWEKFMILLFFLVLNFE